ncbi:uncharacterized protein [Mytilus edulis]|uniref:uncharacterized protein n=1 Tax=Mytilus edulis TaxID=6550 RepID=UPI0039EE70DD
MANNTHVQLNSEAPDRYWSVTLSSQEPSKSNISSLMLNIQAKKSLIKYDKLVLMYLCSLLLTNSYAPEPNPGPRTPKYPCGTCTRAVTWKTEAVCCDSCRQWYHINCQQINRSMYEILGNSNISWECVNCGMPNFSTTSFNTTIETSNSYSELDISNEPNGVDNIGPPNFTSSPLPKKQGKYRNNKNKPNPCKTPLRTLTINFQSMKNKKPEIEQIIESCEPDIIYGTETWLSNTISPYEYISPSKYTVYNKNRKDGYGGVLLAVSNKYVSSLVNEFDTDCEIIWAKITSPNSKTLYLGAYYRPPSDKGESLENMGISLNTACKKTNANIWLSGDFNLGHINWEKHLVLPNKPDPALHQQLLNILDDNNLAQVIDKNTRNDRTLDLMCMTNPSFINRVETLPPIGGSDHDIVFCEINFAIPTPKQHPHKALIYKKANWENIKKDLILIYDHLKANKTNMTIDDLWTTFKTKTTETINKNIPTKVIGKKSKLPWVNRDLKRLIRKKNKLYKKKSHDSKYKNKYKEIKT